MSSSASESHPVVLVTGYGLFRDYTTNASKEAVEYLAKVGVPGIDLHTEILAVDYDVVSKETQKLYDELKPRVVIHCGLSEIAKALTLEKRARNKSYCSPDVKGQLPNENCCKPSIDCDCLETGLDLEKIVSDISSSPDTLPVCISDDAGLYLCEFIYCCALNYSKNSLFIHIPPISDAFPVQKVAAMLQQIILSAVHHVEL